MNMLTLLILAVVVGWLATLIMQSDVRKVSARNFIVAVIGAWLGARFLAPSFGISPITEYGFGMAGTLVSWVAAIVLLAVVKLARRFFMRAIPDRGEVTAPTSQIG